MKTDLADRRTPAAIRQCLAEYGGLNRFGGANWRVIVAEDHRVLRGGVFVTMPSGDVKTLELERLPNGKYLQHYREVKPEKVETGLQMVPRWPCKGWILERWFAPETRSRTEWEAAKSSDGITPMMGPYPEHGYYFMVDGPWEQMPDLAVLRWAISAHIRTENERPKDYQQVMLEEVNANEAAELAAYDKAVKDLAHFYESEVEPVLRGSSLEASRIRQELGRQMGDLSHQSLM